MKRVFFSFRAENKAAVDTLRLTASLPNHPLEFYDESVIEPYDSYNAEYIKRNIREKIRRASVTVCLLDAESHKSKWIAWEIEESLRSENRIIYMGLPGVTTAITLPYPPHRAGEAHARGWHIWNMNLLIQMIEAP
jgi:hypothetical protein